MKTIGIIGCGNMGETILKGIVSGTLASRSTIFVSDVDSTKLHRIKTAYKIAATFNNSMVAAKSDLIIMSVKPQDMPSVLGGISEFLTGKKLLISIAAGVTIRKIRSFIPEDVPVVRVMPNMPSLIMKGFSALSYSGNVKRHLAKAAREIFGSIGETVDVREKDLDAITAISGSGPAYFFYLVELLIESGTKLGLERHIARAAALKTAIGSIELLNRLNEEPAALRKKVTSRGGTTEAAFRVFNKRKLDKIIHNGIKAASERAKELSRE